MQELQKFISASRTGRRRLPNGRKLSKGTIGNYKVLLHLLQEFETKENFRAAIFTGTRINKQIFAQQRKYWQQFYYRFGDFMYRKGYFDNYVANQFKVLRTLLNYLYKEKNWMASRFAPCNYVCKEQISIVVLNPEQLQFLINNEAFYLSLSPALKRVKDIFVTGCTVALRVADLQKLNWKNIEEINGKYYLTVHAAKTQSFTRVLLPGYVMDIFRKYKTKYKTLLPPLANSNLNIQVKKLCEKAGWTNTIAKTRMQRGIAKLRYADECNKSLHRFCDLVTSHTMRRTAITTMLTLGMPEHLVRKVSGHAAGSREFYRYISLSQQYLDGETERVFNFLNQPQP